VTLDGVDLLAVLGSLTVTGGAVLLARGGRPRTIVLAIAVVLVAFPLTIQPVVAPLPLGFWLVGAFLASFLLLTGARDGPRTLVPLPLGGTSEGIFAVLGLLLGYLAAPLAAQGQGHGPALGAGLALAFAALPAAGLGREAFRVGAGVMLVAVAGSLVANGLGGTLPEAIIVALALMVLAAATSTHVLAIPDRVSEIALPRGGARRTARASDDAP